MLSMMLGRRGFFEGKEREESEALMSIDEAFGNTESFSPNDNQEINYRDEDAIKPTVVRRLNWSDDEIGHGTSMRSLEVEMSPVVRDFEEGESSSSKIPPKLKVQVFLGTFYLFFWGQNS